MANNKPGKRDQYESVELRESPKRLRSCGIDFQLWSRLRALDLALGLGLTRRLY